MAGVNLDEWMARMATIVSDAPEEHRHVLNMVKMSKTKKENMKSLGGTGINVEMLAKTLAYLMDIQVTDETISRLLKEGKKDMIVRQLVMLLFCLLKPFLKLKLLIKFKLLQNLHQLSLRKQQSLHSLKK